MIQFYFDLFDRRIKNWTFLLLIISFFIVSAWLLHSPSKSSLTASVLNSQGNSSVWIKDCDN